MRLWFGTRKKDDGPANEPRMSCHGCQSDRIEMIAPVSPEVLSYRCTMCGRQWSVRARTVTELGPRTT
jgi:transposase-like protein